MGGTLNWTSNTNANEDSCKQANCTCATFFEIHQQTAMKLVSNKQSGTNQYKLEPGYEARARRIAATYARIFLEDSTLHGTSNLMGRFYWMGLGAFASKTIAMIFSQEKSKIGYQSNFAGAREPINILAKGNLWLFMDITPWHLAWSSDEKGFRGCAVWRNTNDFKNIQPALKNLPWSSVLPTLNFLQETDQIAYAFLEHLPKIESSFKKNTRESIKYSSAKSELIKHLTQIAIQEQKNILQKICWDDPILRANVVSQRKPPLSWFVINTTLVLSADYNLTTAQAKRINYRRLEYRLPEDHWSSPPDDLKVEVYDSRMNWILIGAAPKYHRLMLNDVGRQYIIGELRKISSWSQSKADPRLINKNSNEGKT
jgi:hypothetical protein